jgi:hypothetical protein
VEVELRESIIGKIEYFVITGLLSK